MHRRRCYNTCQRYFGKVVRIEDRDGYIHLGRIIDITDDSVWIEPVHHSSFDTGFGYYDAGDGAYGGGGCDFCGGLRQCDRCGFGFGGGFDGGFFRRGAFELAFGFIFGIALAALFFI
ncbi:hypothetical protein QUF88_18585 [Bacillus sp. DX1.1]|uniref:hypothetical protein n=1 Tax=unclassified Bacillus (in: firmicutes) TaxID=185979 RepID=UPI002570A128|nr:MULTISPECIES: hypothetical protein [unclassified Bacillus (in: firmicutes)]MDM5155723.1 hypothetical protein [Bacillus sp. DX1.1]WJE80024.1 hypothetical protein QRE67_16115 [Bacillus sp. DX3.1]